MSHDETRPRLRFVRNFAALALLAGATALGCGQSSNDLFSAATGDSNIAAASAGGAATSSSGSGAGDSTIAAGAFSSGGSIVSAGGSTSSAGAASGGVAGSTSSAGASSAGSPSGDGGTGATTGGGGASGGSGGAPAPDACSTRLVKPAALVADFEDGVAGWSGYIGDMSAPVVSTQPGADNTQHAARFTGGAADISGMFDSLPCRDVSDFDGISFWGRSEGSANIRFLAVIPQTDPHTDIGDCNPATMTCSDHPGKPFIFNEQWTLYHAAWSELKQLGFGTKASFANVINALLWINDGQVNHFDFSIDEVEFYKGDPPTP